MRRIVLLHTSGLRQIAGTEDELALGPDRPLPKHVEGVFGAYTLHSEQPRYVLYKELPHDAHLPIAHTLTQL